MRLLFTLLLLSGIVSFSSCKKDTEEFKSIAGTNIKTCNCNPNSTEFIKAEFNGIKMCFDQKSRDQPLSDNVHYYDDTILLDQLCMTRLNSDKSYQISFYILGSSYQKKTLPVIISDYNNGWIDFQLLDMTDLSLLLNRGSLKDSINYFGNSANGFKSSITDTTNGYVKGTFEGNISTMTGKHLQVNNGEFNIKVTRVTHP